MSQRYKQSHNVSGVTHFTKAAVPELEFSRMTAAPTWLVPFNGGDIFPSYYAEVLPHSTFEIDFDYVVRQLSASLRPVMGSLVFDMFAFFVPNRIINDSWRNVLGENSSGYWVAQDVQLAPLFKPQNVSGRVNAVQIPVGSIADLYGFPTQDKIPAVVLEQMNDLKFKGYLSIFNNYFRDQNYQPNIPFSSLNLYQGFLDPVGTSIYYSAYGTTGSDLNTNILPAYSSSNGEYSSGAITKALFGDGSVNSANSIVLNTRVTTWSALDVPLKANKLHDPFTSVLPSPQKGPDVVFNVSGELPVDFKLLASPVDFTEGSSNMLQFKMNNAGMSGETAHQLYTQRKGTGSSPYHYVYSKLQGDELSSAGVGITGWNVAATADLSQAVGITVDELRTAVATQHVYEQLARTGSRYWSFLQGFFGVEVDDPFPDIPTQIGHFRSELDMYQVAQTSASQEGGSPQGSLTAFGYTTRGGALIRKTFLEHGYIHILAVVRHRNLYSTYLAPDNFRRNTLDWYLPQFANISEQPVRLATLNPFREDSMESGIGFQEAFWEYRFEPDRVHGILRSGIEGSLDVWHFGDDYDPDFTHVNGEWLVSNTQEVLDRTLAITSELAPQFIGQFTYKVTKQIPMPVYSIPGLDTI